MVLAAKSSSSSAAPPKVVSTAATCDPTVSIWILDDRTVYLLGTAHISSASADLAGKLIRDVVPDAVFLELEEGASVNYRKEEQLERKRRKLKIHRHPRKAEAGSRGRRSSAMAQVTSTAGQLTQISDMMRRAPKGGGKALDFGAAAVGSVVKGMYEGLGQAGFDPGEEFVLALRAGQEVGASIVWGDQDAQVTLRRLTEALAATDHPDLERCMRLLMTGGIISEDPEELKNVVEKIKTRESVRKITKQLNDIAPALAQAMITERDAYMASKLDALTHFPSIVAVMGIGHMDGVENNLRQKGWSQVSPKRQIKNM